MTGQARFKHSQARALALIACCALASGCAGRAASPRGQAPASSNEYYGPQPQVAKPADAPEFVGPMPPETYQGPPEPTGPVGPQPGPDFVAPQDGYVLILGPGLARSLAYLGVLHEMEERQLPIRAIVGVEMGAVIGAIWASSNVNSLEWEMHKFKKETLLDFPLLGPKVAEGKKLVKFLNEAVKVNQLQKMKVPLFVASAPWEEGQKGVYFDSVGGAVEVVRAAVGIPGVIKPQGVDGKARVTSALESPFPAAKAKALGLGKVVCVDVVGSGNNFKPKDGLGEQLSAMMRSSAAIAAGELKDCDAVLPVPTDGVDYLDFEAKADLIFQGREAVKKWIDRKE